MTHLAIRADGGPDIGYGHLVRTSAVATVLRDEGHEITVATTSPGIVREVYTGEDTIVELPSRGDVRPFLSEIRNHDPDAVLTDAYPVDGRYQRAVRDQYPLLVVQDDARHPVCPDILINANLYAAELDYDVLGPEPRWCLGPAYLPLRTEIADLAGRDPPWRDEPERAIVTMGGSDLEELTPTILRAFNGFDLEVDAIVGPGFSDRQERGVHDAAQSVSADVRVARDPDDLPERMLQADFAVSTSSTTAYELLSLGTPTIAVPQVPNQVPIARSLRQRNLATVISKNPDPSEVRTAVEAYIDGGNVRRQRRDKGKELIDCNGARRVATQVLKLTSDEAG